MTVYLDGAKMTDKASAHDHLAERFALPGWYGRNLDALYDCLTDLVGPKDIILLHSEQMRSGLGTYGEQIIEVLRDAADQVPGMALTIL